MEDLLSLLKELHGLPVHIDINSRTGQRPQHVILHSLTKEVLWSEYVEEEKAKNNREVIEIDTDNVAVDDVIKMMVALVNTQKKITEQIRELEVKRIEVAKKTIEDIRNLVKS